MIDEKKLIERLEEESVEVFREPTVNDEPCSGLIPTGEKDIYLSKIKKIVNQLAEEYNNDVCEWNYSTFDEDLIRPYHHKDSVGMYKECLKSNPFCSCCGKKIKVVE